MSERDKVTPCCLCDSAAVAIYYMPLGCAARPDLTVQPLCAHHESKRTPVGDRAEKIKDLRVIGRRPDIEVAEGRRSPKQAWQARIVWVAGGSTSPADCEFSNPTPMPADRPATENAGLPPRNGGAQ